MTAFVCALERSERAGRKRCTGQCESCATWWPVESAREATERGKAAATCKDESPASLVGRLATDEKGQRWRCVSESDGERDAFGCVERKTEWRPEQEPAGTAICTSCGRSSTDNVSSLGTCLACGAVFRISPLPSASG